MDISQAQQLLSGFGASLGLPELSLDDSGHCALVFDEVAVNIDFIGETQDLLVYSLLGILDNAQRGDPTLLLPLLQANYFSIGTAGGQIGIDNESGAVSMSRAYPLRLLDLPALSASLQAFVSAAEYWKTWLSVLDEELDEPAGTAASLARMPQGNPGMIRA